MTELSTREKKQALNHSLREPMIRELHSRPFLKLKAPCRLAFLALKPEEDGTHTPHSAREQLLAFLDRFGVAHPKDGAVYYFVDLGGMILKWENHSEFATYTLFSYQPKPATLSAHSFATDLHAHFAVDWLEAFPARIVSSISVRIELAKTKKVLEALMSSVVHGWFGSPTSFAASYVTDGSAAVAADFDLDHNGQIRLAVLACDDIGPGRIGRVVQRFLEIETYRAMSMLSLPVARGVLARLRAIDDHLSRTVEKMADETESDKAALDELLQISTDLSLLSSQSAFRFSAGRAYETLVMQRLDLLREERIQGRQLFSEFMTRRYSPTMRTCESAQDQLNDLIERTAHASDLLGTRVSVTTAEQNRKLLAQMDKRAALQARLQETVEGLSVVAISYYAVSLLTYLLAPFAKLIHVDKTLMAATLVVPVAAVIWLSMHRIKRRLFKKPISKDAEG